MFSENSYMKMIDCNNRVSKFRLINILKNTLCARSAHKFEQSRSLWFCPFVDYTNYTVSKQLFKLYFVCKF